MVWYAVVWHAVVWHAVVWHGSRGTYPAIWKFETIPVELHRDDSSNWTNSWARGSLVGTEREYWRKIDDEVIGRTEN
jgi:hypothetical protein